VSGMRLFLVGRVHVYEHVHVRIPGADVHLRRERASLSRQELYSGRIMPCARRS
jgi:hypothetical protein